MNPLILAKGMTELQKAQSTAATNKRWAHIDNGKVVNISVWAETPPAEIGTVIDISSNPANAHIGATYDAETKTFTMPEKLKPSTTPIDTSVKGKRTIEKTS
jgi:hypothetical protein